MDDMPERVKGSLDVVVHVAKILCAKYPHWHGYFDDFVQEGNLKLIQTHQQKPDDWSIDHFHAYVAVRARGAMIDYLSQIHPISIPHGSRRYIDPDRLEMLENHHPYDNQFNLSSSDALASPSNIAAKKRVEELLLLLPDHERLAVTLYFGLNENPKPPREVGLHLGMPAMNAKKIVNMALKRMAGQIGPSMIIQSRVLHDKLQAAYQDKPSISGAELSRLAGCSDVTALRFLKKQKGV